MSEFIPLPPPVPPPPPPPPPPSTTNNMNMNINNSPSFNFQEFGRQPRGRGRGRSRGRGYLGSNNTNNRRQGRGNHQRTNGGNHHHHHHGGRGGGRQNNRNNNNRMNGNRGGGVQHTLQVNNDLVDVEEVGIPLITEPTDPTAPTRNLHIAVQGCAHGALDRIYETLQLYEQKKQADNPEYSPIDLLICCGDFQSLRNTSDLSTISVPQKYRELGSFHHYYSGIKHAPYLTIFIGGNHEASAYLQELYYGGWVAPNIYYLGAAGVVRWRGLRIAGCGGIYKGFDYGMGRWEVPPYDCSEVRSVYHVRNVDVARLKCLSLPSPTNHHNNGNNKSNIDIMISHDWPRGIEQHGNTAALIRKKKFFAKEIQENSLGSPANEELLNVLKPTWWFAAHLHVKFKATYHHHRHDNNNNNKHSAAPSSATTNTMFIPSQVKRSIPHTNNTTTSKPVNNNHTNITPNETSSTKQHTTFIGVESPATACAKATTGADDLTDMMTKFLSLDKCLPRKHYLQIINMPSPEPGQQGHATTGVAACSSSTNDDDASLHYDLEWLAILKKTHHWTNKYRSRSRDPDISDVHIRQEDIDTIRQKLKVRLQTDSRKTEHPTSINDANDMIDETRIPNDFTMTAHPHGTVGSDTPMGGGKMIGNPQTDRILSLLDLDHIITTPYLFASGAGAAEGCSSSKEKEQSLRMESNRIAVLSHSDQSGTVDNKSTTQHQPDANEIELEFDSESEESQTNKETAMQCQPDLNEIELDSDSEQSESNGITQSALQSDSNEIDLDSS